MNLWQSIPLSPAFICNACILFLSSRMIDDKDLGFFSNFLGIFIFVAVVAYHFVMAEPKYEG